jgi:hypothetical protein
MIHEQSQGDGATKGIVRFKIRQVPRDGCIGVEGAPFDQLHDQHIGEELADRTDAVESLRIGRVGSRGVRKSHCTRPLQSVARDQADGNGGHFLVVTLALGGRQNGLANRIPMYVARPTIRRAGK